MFSLVCRSGILLLSSGLAGTGRAESSLSSASGNGRRSQYSAEVPQRSINSSDCGAEGHMAGLDCAAMCLTLDTLLEQLARLVGSVVDMLSGGLNVAT